MRYNKKAQEELFNPYRLALVRGVQPSYHMYSRGKYYWLLRLDMSRGGKPDAVYHKPREDKHGTQVGDRWELIGRQNLKDVIYGQGYTTKADAVRAAKVQAVALGVPFDPDKDIVFDIAKLVYGPLRTCLTCGAENTSWEPFVCKQCKRLLTVGRATLEGSVSVNVDLHNVLPVYFNEEGSSREHEAAEIVLDLLSLGGYVADSNWFDRPDEYVGPDLEAERGGKSSSRDVLASYLADRKWVRVYMRPGDIDTLRRVYLAIRRSMRITYVKGIEQGQGFLREIASGRLTVQEINDKQARIDFTEKHL